MIKCNLLQFKRAAGWQLIGSCANKGLESAWLCRPLAEGFIVETQCLLIDGETNSFRLARLEHHLLEGFQLLQWPFYAALLVGDVELYGFCASETASICDINCEGYFFI